MLATRPTLARASLLAARPTAARARRASVAARAGGLDTNFFVNAIASTVCVAVPAAVAVLTSEDTDAELKRLQSVEGAAPFAAAALADAVAHSVPGLNVLLSLLAEPAGAAAGVAYMMSLILSSPAVDPATLAPKGTVLNAEKAADARGAVRVPFTRILPTALNVIDWSNSGSSGAGWKPGPDGLPKLPLNSVLIVVGVGSLILEAASHAPVLGIFMPRVLQVAGWLAAAGYVLDQRK